MKENPFKLLDVFIAVTFCGAVASAAVVIVALVHFVVKFW